MTEHVLRPAPRILAIGAHPDDVEIYCLGLLLRLQMVGWEIGWAVATDGTAGLPSGSPDDLRRREALLAGSVVGVTPQLMGLIDGALRGTPTDQGAVADAIAAFRPDVLVSHNRDDYHPDHRTLARLVREACPPGTLLLEADTMLGAGFWPDIHVDVSAVHALKMQALDAHASQAAPVFRPKLDCWSAFRALHCGIRGASHAEGYRALPTAATSHWLHRLTRDLTRD